MRDIILTIIIFGSIPFILWRPYIGALMWAWLSYMNPHRLAFGFAYNLPFAASVGLATIFSFAIAKEKKKLPMNGLTFLLITFILWISITTYFAYSSNAIEEWKRTIKILLMAILTLSLLTNRERINGLVWVIVLSIGFYGVKGGLFGILSGGAFRVWGPEKSFIYDNNTLALALVMIIPLMFYLFQQTENKWIKRALLISIGLCAVSVILSYSRGAFLAVSAIGVSFWLKSNKKIIIGIMLVIVIAASLPFIPDKWFDRISTLQTYQEDASAMGRINAWAFSINIANDRPLIGGGFDVFKRSLFQIYAPDPEDFHDSHSIYFEVLAEQGYVGLIIFLSIGLLTYSYCRRTKKLARKSDGNYTWAYNLSTMIQISLMGYAVGGAFLGLAYYDLPYSLVILAISNNEVLKQEIANDAG